MYVCTTTITAAGWPNARAPARRRAGRRPCLRPCRPPGSDGGAALLQQPWGHLGHPARAAAARAAATAHARASPRGGRGGRPRRRLGGGPDGPRAVGAAHICICTCTPHSVRLSDGRTMRATDLLAVSSLLGCWDQSRKLRTRVLAVTASWSARVYAVARETLGRVCPVCNLLPVHL